MLRALLIAAAALTLTSPVLAKTDASADKAMEPAFSGTIVSTYPDGRKGELWLNKDGTYRAEGRRGDKSNGHWTLSGDKVCLKQSSPLPVPFAFCTPKPTTTTWHAKAVSGEPITVHIEKGGRA